MRILIWTAVLILIFLTNSVHAQQTQSKQASEPVVAASAEQNTIVDRLHSGTTNLMQTFIGRTDYFFLDDDYESFADNPSHMRLRFDVSWIEDYGWDEKFKLKLHLVLPGLSNRSRLVAGGDDDDEVVAAEEDGKDLALRWVGLQTDNAAVSFDLGLRYKSSDLDPFVRLNTGIQYKISENWYGLTYNRLYYCNTYWRNDFRQSFNRPISNDLLFRARTRVQYFDENDYNPFLEQKFSLFQTLDQKSVVAYEALWVKEAEEDYVYDDDEIEGRPQDNYQDVELRMRYRRNVWCDWLHIEVWPIVGWAEERDWDMSTRGRHRIRRG